MADPPAVPPPAPPSPLVATFNPYATVNLDEARKQKDQYGADLAKTRGALSDVQGKRMDVTTRNLAAIDESIKGLQEARTGTYGLDPAVTAAMAAGFLRTTPGQSSNFMGELGNAMAAAAPVVGSLQKQDRDSFQILADLQRKRGEFEAEPYKERQKELSEREKLEFANLKEAEKALARAPAGAPTAKTAVDIENLIQDVFKDAEPQIKQETEDKSDADGNPLTVEQKSLIRKYIYAERVRRHNLGKSENSPMYIPPDKAPLSEAEKTQAEALMNKSRPTLKGIDKLYDDYRRSQLAKDQNNPDNVPLSQPDWEAKSKSNVTFQAERAKDDAEKYAKGPTAIRTAQKTLDHVETMMNHPGMAKVISPNPLVRGLPNWTPDADEFASMHETLQSKLFLSSVELMKGTGPLSNAEGVKVQAALSALSGVKNPEVYRANLRKLQTALTGLQDAVRQDMAKIEERRNPQAPTPQQTATATPTPEHIEMLKKDPSLADFFDKTYGPGAANKVLGR